MGGRAPLLGPSSADIASTATPIIFLGDRDRQTTVTALMSYSMSEIRDRLLHKLSLLPSVFPDRQAAEVVAERVAGWLKRSAAEPTCTVRTGGILVIAGRQESMLRLTISQTIFQLDDSAKLRESSGGFSVLQPGVPSTIVEIPVSEICGSEQGAG